MAAKRKKIHSRPHEKAGVDPTPWGEILCDALLADTDDAIRHLSLLEADPTRAIHQARRRMKRLRAALALLATTGQERQVIALAGRRLGPLRDAQVKRQLTGHPSSFPDGLVPFPLGPAVRERVHSAQLALVGFRFRIVALTGVGDSHIDPPTLDDLVARLVRSERQARRRLKHLSTSSGEADSYHEARKAVKRLLHQYQTLGLFQGKTRLLALDELGERLGDHHDLSLVEREFTPKKFRKRMTLLESEIDSLADQIMSRSVEKQTVKIGKALSRRGRVDLSGRGHSNDLAGPAGD